MELFKKVISIINSNKKNCIDIKPDDDLISVLGIDSLDTLMIINEIEDEFAIEFDGNDLGNIRTVNDITSLLTGKYIK